MTRRTVVLKQGLVLAAALLCGWLVALAISHPSAARSSRSAQLVALASNVAKADGTVGVSIEVVTGDPQVPCSGGVTHDGHHFGLPKLVTSATGGGQWSWRIPKAVPKGRWTVHVTCRLRGKLRRAAESLVADRGTGPGKRNALFTDGSLRKGTFNVAANDDAGGSGAAGSNGSLYPIGQCTWWVARKRPDLPYFPRHKGDAKNWATSAQAAGFPIDRTPRVGDVAVFQPGQQKAGSSGHVAYVEQIKGNVIWISEANFGERHPGSERHFDWTTAGLLYIHHIATTTTTTTQPQTQTDPPTTTTIGPGTTTATTTIEPQRVTHYQCDAGATTLGHTVEAGHHWGGGFETAGTEITNGDLYVAAQDDKADHSPHRATVGIYTDSTLSAALGKVDVTVPVGGTGVSFTFPSPVAVDFQEHLWIAITAIDRFTAYDVDDSATNPGSPDGCFIGRLEGTKPPTFTETAVPESSVPTFEDHRSASGPGPSISANQAVEVFCKVYDAAVPSASPGGYWYKIASGPWSGHFYATANAFLNDDPPGGPYHHSTDLSVPDC
jgi:surface antigen